MSVELLTYAELAERLKTSPEAARSLAKRLRLPRSRGNDGKARVAIDFAEIRYTAMPARSAAGRRQDTAALKAQIAALQAQVTELEDEAAKLEALAGGHRADYGRERDRADRLMTEMLKATADVMTAKEATARFEGELAAWRSRPWWKRVAG